MYIWTDEYFPPSGEPYSPKDFIRSIQPQGAAAIIDRRIDSIKQMKSSDWPSSWVKKVDNLYQLKAGDHRVYFDIVGDKIIVVCYVCRKVSQKALKKDLRRAHINLENYLKGEGST